MDNPLELLGLEQLRSRTSMKWRAYDPDVLPLWVAEMDVPQAPAVVEAVCSAMQRGDTGYPAGTGYADALAEFAAARWGWSFDAGATRLVPDVMLGVVEVLKLVTQPGDRVVVNSPVYPPFYAFVRHMDREVVEVPLGADLRLDLPALERTFGEITAGGRSAAYLLCSPHNPTGTVHSRDELAAVAAAAAAHGVRVVADEIHAPVVHGSAPFVAYLSVDARGFSLLSASKGWNLAGLKAAVAVAGPAALDDLQRMPEEVGHGPSHIGILGHTAALRDGVDWLDAVLAGVASNVELLRDLLARHLPQIRFVPPVATYLTWLDCRALDLGPGPAGVFLERGRVALTDGRDFGTGGEGFVRLNIATSAEILTEAVQRMVAAVSG